MSILKRQVSSSSDFSPFISVITYNSPVSLQLMHVLLWTKESHENTNFDTFKWFWWKFVKFLMSFSKPQASFSSNFAWLFSFMKDNSSILFKVKRCILCTQGTNQSASLLDFLVLESKFTKFLSKQKISFSSNFAPLFSIMRHISSILFLAETLYTFSKSSLSN